MTKNNSLSNLNPPQREVVLAQRGAVLALAGAGTGKTHTVIARIAHLIDGGMAPENILAVTFTNKAAEELKTRLHKIIPRSVNLSALLACTFHSLCVRIIRRDAALIKLEKHFTIINQGEQLAIVRKASRHVHGGAKNSPDAMLSAISRLKSRGITAATFAQQAIEESEMSLASVYRKYQEALKLRGVVDFDDLLLLALELLEKYPASGDYWAARFQQIVVDEFQDTSDIQYRIVSALSRQWGNLCVVGDDDQSIYSWRGAMPTNILNFKQLRPNAQIIFLRENYRSRNAILRVANALIASNISRHKKELFSQLGDGEKPRLYECADQNDEAAMIIREIKEKISGGKFRPRDFAIIIRANAQSQPLESQLRLEKIPFSVIGGQSFFDGKEVLDMLAYLRVIVNPHDDGALRRIVNTPARGIGDKTLEHLIHWAEKNHKPLSYALNNADKIAELTNAARQSCRDFSAQISKWRTQSKSEQLNNLVETIIKDIDYQQEVDHLYDAPLMRISRLELAREVGADWRSHLAQGVELVDYLSETSLTNNRQDAKKTDDNTVKIITIHSAKGLEYPVVYLTGLEENNLPHKNSIEENNLEEERRLFYVAITRARYELTLTYCAERIMSNEKSKPTVRSRFLGEIPPELLTVQSFRPAAANERAEIFAKIRQQFNRED